MPLSSHHIHSKSLHCTLFYYGFSVFSSLLLCLSHVWSSMPRSQDADKAQNHNKLKINFGLGLDIYLPSKSGVTQPWVGGVHIHT